MIEHHPLPDDIDAKLERLAARLAAMENVSFVYLFGSLARGRRTPISDVDIAVFLKNPESPALARLDLIGELSDALGSDQFDLVILNRAPLSLTGRILLNRRVLVDKDPAVRHRYESETLRKFYDFRRKEEAILQQRFS